MRGAALGRSRPASLRIGLRTVRDGCAASASAVAMNAALPSLASKVAFLSQAGSYGEKLHRVERIETHMSWVFLAGHFAYKLKKPVRTDLFDFGTLTARHHYCNEELRLNRRTAREIYLSLISLTLDDEGHLHLGGGGPAVDWLVKMRRVPSSIMLDFKIAHGSASRSDTLRIAQFLARFHLSLPSESLAPAAYLSRFRGQIEAHRVQLMDATFGLPAARTGTLHDAQTQALMLLSALLGERASRGALVEGHGDLRPEHICLLPEVAAIDCLEFSRDLRILDRADEAGYLALECERLGAPGIAQALLRAYCNHAGDRPPASLIHFYQSCRASTRALLALRHLKEEKFRYSPHWRRTASLYLDLAMEHAHASRAR